MAADDCLGASGAAHTVLQAVSPSKHRRRDHRSAGSQRRPGDSEELRLTSAGRSFYNFSRLSSPGHKMRCLPILMSSLLLACPALADWVILADGQRTRVLAFEITDRAVHMTTLTGKRWSVLRSAVDVEETLAANETKTPPEVVRIEPVVPPPPAPPPSPAAPPPETVVELEPAPPRAPEPRRQSHLLRLPRRRQRPSSNSSRRRPARPCRRYRRRVSIVFR